VTRHLGKRDPVQENYEATMNIDSWLPPTDSPQQKALAYVATRSLGTPLDSTLRVTINVHPAR